MNTTIKSIIDERGITELYHFTRIENLESIVEHGILPVSEMKKEGLHFLDNDKYRNDHRIDCNCISISYPNLDLLKSYKRKYGGHWVMIELDPRVLYETPCYFAEHNAATRVIASNLWMRTGADALENMFQRRLEIQLADRVEPFSRFEVKDFPNFPTSPQAEVLVKGRISIDLVKNITFENMNDADKYRGVLDEKNIKSCVNNEVFTMNRYEWIQNCRVEQELERIFAPWLKKSAS